MGLRDRLDKFGMVLPVSTAATAAVWVFYKFASVGALSDGMIGFIITSILAIAAAIFGGMVGLWLWSICEKCLLPSEQKKQADNKEPRESVCGDWNRAEEFYRQVKQNVSRQSTRRYQTRGKSNFDNDEQERSLKGRQFLRYLFSMLAKIAKADGHVSKREVDVALRAFELYNAANECREFCTIVFNNAVNDSHSIYWYAEEFRKVTPDEESTVYLYELLWDVACADGVLKHVEKDILRRICASLRIDEAWYDAYYRKCIGPVVDEELQGKEKKRQENHKTSSRKAYQSGMSPLEDAYALLGCLATMTDAELLSAYRSAAKRYHPDRLKANGVPEVMRAEADEKMKQVNAAWNDIRRARGI